MSRFDPNLYVGVDQLGAMTSDLQEQLDEGAQQALLSETGADIPIIDSTFAALYRSKKGKVFVTLRFAQYGAADDIKLVIVARAEILTADDYIQKRKIGKIADKIPPGTLTWVSEVQMNESALEPNTQYDVIRLIAIANETDRAVNPTPDPVYAAAGPDPGYPANVIYTFTTPTSTAHPPGKPTLARIVGNTPDFVKVRIYADETELLTFLEQGTTHVQPFFHRLSDSGDKVKPIEAVEDPSLTFQDVQVPVGDPEVSSGVLRTGLEFEQDFNRAWSGGDFADAPSTSAVTFFAGGYRNPDDGADLDNAMVNLTCAFTVNGAEPNDGTRVSITCTLTQPTPPYRLRNARLFRRKSSQTAADNELVDQKSLADPEFNVSGDVDVVFSNVPTKASKEYVFTLEVTGILQPDAPHHSFESDPFTASTAQASTSITAGSGGPSFVNGGAMVLSLFDYDGASSATFLGKNWGVAPGSATKIDNLAGGGGGSLDNQGLQWRNTEGRLMLNTDCVTKGGQPAAKIFGHPFRPGKEWGFSCLWIADTAAQTKNITIALYDAGNAADIVAVTLNSFVIPITTPAILFVRLLVPTGYVMNGKQWIYQKFNSDPTQKCYTNYWMLDPDPVYKTWRPHAEESTIDPGTSVTSHNEGTAQNPSVVVVSGDGMLIDGTTIKGGLITL